MHITRNKYIIFLITIAAMLAAFQSRATCITNPPNFRLLTYSEADKLVSAQVENIVSSKLDSICPEYVSNLIGQIQGQQLTYSNKVLAIYLLGELRPEEPEAIKCLIANIDFKAWLDREGTIPRWDDYPAKEALLAIGKPAIKPVLDELPFESNPERRRSMCEVLVFANRKAEHLTEHAAKEMLKRQILREMKSATNSSSRANLKSCLDGM